MNSIQVIKFSGVRPAYLPGERVELTYHVLDKRETSSADWITINQIPQNISYFPGHCWSATNTGATSHQTTLTMPQTTNEKTNQLYEFIYIGRSGRILGHSDCFRLQRIVDVTGETSHATQQQENATCQRMVSNTGANSSHGNPVDDIMENCVSEISHTEVTASSASADNQKKLNTRNTTARSAMPPLHKEMFNYGTFMQIKPPLCHPRKQKPADKSLEQLVKQAEALAERLQSIKHHWNVKIVDEPECCNSTASEEVTITAQTDHVEELLNLQRQNRRLKVDIEDIEKAMMKGSVCDRAAQLQQLLKNAEAVKQHLLRYKRKYRRRVKDLKARIAQKEAERDQLEGDKFMSEWLKDARTSDVLIDQVKCLEETLCDQDRHIIDLQQEYADRLQNLALSLEHKHTDKTPASTAKLRSCGTDEPVASMRQITQQLPQKSKSIDPTAAGLQTKERTSSDNGARNVASDMATTEVSRSTDFDLELVGKLLKLLLVPNPPAIPVEWFNSSSCQQPSQTPRPATSASVDSVDVMLRSLLQSESGLKEPAVCTSTDSVLSLLRRWFSREQAPAKVTSVTSSDSLASAMRKLFDESSAREPASQAQGVSSSESLYSAFRQLFDLNSDKELSRVTSRDSILSIIRKMFETESQTSLETGQEPENVLSSDSLASVLRNLFEQKGRAASDESLEWQDLAKLLR